MKTIVYFTLLVGLVCFARKGKSISAKSISAVALSNPPVIFTHTKTLFRDSSAAHGSYNRQNGYRIVIYIIWLLVYLMTEGRILVLVVEIFEILSVVRKKIYAKYFYFLKSSIHCLFVPCTSGLRSTHYSCNYKKIHHIFTLSAFIVSKPSH